MDKPIQDPRDRLMVAESLHPLGQPVEVRRQKLVGLSRHLRLFRQYLIGNAILFVKEVI